DLAGALDPLPRRRGFRLWWRMGACCGAGPRTVRTTQMLAAVSGPAPSTAVTITSPWCGWQARSPATRQAAYDALSSQPRDSPAGDARDQSCSSPRPGRGRTPQAPGPAPRAGPGPCAQPRLPAPVLLGPARPGRPAPEAPAPLVGHACEALRLKPL